MSPIRFAGKTWPRRARAGQIGSAGRFIFLAVFAAIVFVFGGASRPDILPLLILRPLSVAACGWALFTMPAGKGGQHRWLWWLAAAIVFSVAIQLVPLPPGLWQTLPGRALVAEADRVAGLGLVWRPISLTPDLTWNSLFALVIPLATLLMVVALPQIWSQRLCWVLIAAGLTSGLLGVFQIVGTINDSLPYYRASGNAGAAVGLFANRNHAAVFLACLLPVLAAFAGRERHRQVVAGATAIVLVPLIIATGSRAGVLIGGIGILLGCILLLDERMQRRRGSPVASRPRWLIPAFALIALLLVAVAVLAPTTAWDRLLSSGSASEKRLRAWPVVVRLAREQMPSGSGYGSFDPVFRSGEPMNLLSPTYFNHAHNDWLELWMTGGILAILLLAIATAAWTVASIRVWRGGTCERGERLGRAGSAVLLMLALASIVDYPLRTPSLSMFAAIAVGWLTVGQRREADWNGATLRPNGTGRTMRESDV
jgi:O-antigen ligase